MEELQRKVEFLEEQIFDFLLTKYISDLKKNGYVIIPNVITDEEIKLQRIYFISGKIIFLIMIKSIHKLTHMVFINFIKLGIKSMLGI